MPRVVILGTGTGVGKTFVACALAHALRAVTRHAVLALKPIETGIVARALTGAPPAGSDAAALERAAATGTKARPHPLYGFPDPVSPHLASRRADRPIILRKIGRWVESAEEAVRDTTPRYTTVIECAGGAFSPISSRCTNVDLALILEPAICVLVAPDALGVLHDVRATVLAMRARGRDPDYLVLSSARRQDPSAGSNAEELPRVGLPRPIAVVPRGDRRGASLRGLARLIQR